VLVPLLQSLLPQSFVFAIVRVLAVVGFRFRGCGLRFRGRRLRCHSFSQSLPSPSFVLAVVAFIFVVVACAVIRFRSHYLHRHSFSRSLPSVVVLRSFVFRSRGQPSQSENRIGCIQECIIGFLIHTIVNDGHDGLIVGLGIGRGTILIGRAPPVLLDGHPQARQ
jgi:hypothetical protein